METREPAQLGHRLLVVDDNVDIHRLMRSILQPPTEARDERLDELADALFDEAPLDEPKPTGPSVRPDPFQVDSAHQGEEAIQMVRRAAHEGAPYFLAFVDIRMPPGMDGIKTVKALWEEYPDLYVVVCSAYSDYTWLALSENVGYSPNLLILRKPFDPIEVRQLVSTISKMYRVLAGIRYMLDDYQETVSSLTLQLAAKTNAIELLLESSAEAVFVVSHDGSIRQATAEAGRMLGASRADLIGKDFHRHVPLRFDPDVVGRIPQQTVEARTVDGSPRSMEVRLVAWPETTQALEKQTAYLCICREAIAP